MALLKPNGEYVKVDRVKIDKFSDNQEIILHIYETKEERQRHKMEPKNPFIRFLIKSEYRKIINSNDFGSDLKDSIVKSAYAELKKKLPVETVTETQPDGTEKVVSETFKDTEFSEGQDV